MWFFYLFACVPAAIGALLWVKDKEVVWWEWLLGSGLAFVQAVIFHVIAYGVMTGDTETWSGQVLSATHHPWWKERYVVPVTKKVGKNTIVTLEVRYRDHSEYWDCETNIHAMGVGISEQKYGVIKQILGGVEETRTPHKSGFCEGDKNVYLVANRTNQVVPVTAQHHWVNKVQCAPSVFKFIKVPEDVKVYKYPENNNVFTSARIVGSCPGISIYEWDQMNAILGPSHKVNLVMVGFPTGSDSMLGQYQEAKWFGGKKNDLVLCFAKGEDGKTQWAYVFGWTEKAEVKRNLESILMGNPVDMTIIPLIWEEVLRNYQIKDWSKFDYLSLEPPTWCYIVFIILMLLIQGGFYVFAHVNDTRSAWANRTSRMTKTPWRM